MSGTPIDDILQGEAAEDPPGLTEEGYRKREERLRAIRAELEAQRRDERRAKMTAEELLDEDVEPMELRGNDLDTIFHWFTQLEDMWPACLMTADHELANRIAAQLGRAK